MENIIGKSWGFAAMQIQKQKFWVGLQDWKDRPTALEILEER